MFTRPCNGEEEGGKKLVDMDYLIFSAFGIAKTVKLLGRHLFCLMCSAGN